MQRNRVFPAEPVRLQNRSQLLRIRHDKRMLGPLGFRHLVKGKGKCLSKKSGQQIAQFPALCHNPNKIPVKCITPANKNHACLKPCGIGRALRTKINVNLGVSRDCLDLDEEFKKVEAAVAMGAEAIMDLSSFGDTKAFRQKLVHDCTAVLGTVPIYDAVVYYNKPLKTITSDEWIDVVRMHAQEGVDFMTIHCGINRETARKFKENKRHTNIVSRGGSIIFAWMELTGEENPFYARFDEILEICREYDVTLSLGDACRPGSIADAGDIPQIEELVTLGELTQRAWKRDVQVMIEGPGHMPLNQIRANMEIEQTVPANIFSKTPKKAEISAW